MQSEQLGASKVSCCALPVRGAVVECVCRLLHGIASACCDALAPPARLPGVERNRAATYAQHAGTPQLARHCFSLPAIAGTDKDTTG